MSLSLTARALMEAIQQEIDRDPAVAFYPVWVRVERDDDYYEDLPPQRIIFSPAGKKFTIVV